jgi:hypothetical protein
MSTVTEIIEALKQLDVEAKREFLTRISEVDFEDAWDRQRLTRTRASSILSGQMV